MLLKTIYVKLSQGSVLLPIATGFSNYKALTRPFKILLYFFVSCIGFEIVGSVTKQLYHNNMPGQHVYTLVEFLVFSSVYYYHFKKKGVLRLIILVNAIFFIGIAMLDAFYIGGIKQANTLSRSYASTSISIYTLIYFYHLFQKDGIIYIWEYAMFWVCTGSLIYFTGSDLYVMLKSYLLVEAANVEWFSNLLHVLLNIIAHCLYAQSFRCLKTQTV